MGDHVFVGKPLNIRIISIDRDTDRMTGSIKQASATHVAKAALTVGDTVEGVVAEIHADQVALTLQPSEARALLSLGNLANHRNVKIAALKKSLAVGEKLTDLEIVAKNEDNGLIIVSNTRKENLEGYVAPSGSLSSELDLNSLKPGQIVPARVSGRDGMGYWLRVTKGIKGRVAVADLTDDFSKLPEELVQGSVVKCCVIKVDKKTKQLDLSIRPSRVNTAASSSSGKISDPEVEDANSLKVGQKIRGFVKNIATSGLYVSLGRSVTARVIIREMFDDVSNWFARSE